MEREGRDRVKAVQREAQVLGGTNGMEDIAEGGMPPHIWCLPPPTTSAVQQVPCTALGLPAAEAGHQKKHIPKQEAPNEIFPC